MKLDFRQRLLTTSLLVGASVIATPAFAQDTTPGNATPPECPPGTVPGDAGVCNPADTSQGTGTQPETTTPVEGSTVVPSTSASGEPVKEAADIVITGSRIPQPNLTSSSPVTVLSSQEVKLSGTSRTEDLVNSLPQSFAGQGSNISNGSSGTATVNLRNLGAARTLVLVNGRRLQPGDILSPFPDINFVPSQLIKRVDVLTGGASSVYGADAVGGVVNFIMDNTFTGVRLDAQVSGFMHDNRNDGAIQFANDFVGYRPPEGLSFNGGAADIAAVIGAAFDDGRGHVQAYATYRRQRPVLQNSRDYSFCNLDATETPDIPVYGEYFCGGSLTGTNAVFFAPGNGFFGSVGPDRTFVEGYTLFNYAPYNYYQRPDERYTFGAFADYEISSAFKPYMEAMFMNDRSIGNAAPSGIFFGNITSLNCDNALLSDQQRALICDPANINSTFVDPVTGNTVDVATVIFARRNVEGGARLDDIQHTGWRIVGGLRGDIARGVSYDAFYQYGRTTRDSVYSNDFSLTRAIRATDVIDNPDTPEFDPVCRSVLTGVDPDCVPYDIFSPGQVNPAALTYLQTPGFQRGIIQQTVAHADVTVIGEEYGLKLPWAENGLGFNFGAEYRKDQMDFQTDLAFSSGDLTGGGGPRPPVQGAYDVRELFVETQIPIVENNFIDLLQLSAGYRYSDYKVIGGGGYSTDTWKIAGEFAPIPDVRFRASYNRAVRAPNVLELFFPQSLVLAGTNDPCAGNTPAATLAQCQATGVTAAQYGNILANPANQYNGLAGGNPDLQPEVAKSWTAGVILQPRFIPGLAITADYFNIKVSNVIGTPSYGGVLQACFDGDQASCDLIVRDQFGSLWISQDPADGGYIAVLNNNFPGVGLSTKGWDFSGSYSRRVGSIGTVNASYIATLQGKTNTLGGAGTGKFNPDVYPINKYRHKLRLGFQFPNGIGLSGQWRYFSKVTQGEPTITAPAAQKIPAMSYFDLTMTARITNKFNLRFGAQNVFDKPPPIIPASTLVPVFGNGNTTPQIYDALGRYLFAGVTVDF